MLRSSTSGALGEGGAGSQVPPTPNTRFFWYDVDPLLKKQVFIIETQVSQKIPLKKGVFGAGGLFFVWYPVKRRQGSFGDSGRT